MADNFLRIALQKKTEELHQRDSVIDKLRSELEARNKLIASLKVELEKFGAAMKPLLDQMSRHMHVWSSGDEEDSSSLSSSSSSSESERDDKGKVQWRQKNALRGQYQV
ncbi:hypothetical protein CEXT_811171 [Caerostris extrusa]|uniref:Uncharacterized protein n=1 Tax=Caerostris extrusa TaxID=172846 RepID=A0AAV4W0A4_CAEEX|nr:hypothetical protein CEXT_811171 [Caerostris extrusa]